MNTQWLETVGDQLNRSRQIISMRLAGLAEPTRLRQLKLALYAAAVLWILYSLAALSWSLLPHAAVPEPAVILNPQGGGAVATDVDIEALVGRNLFGTAGSKPVAEIKPAEQPQAGAAGSLEGIEKRARETRLSLKLQGIVASDDLTEARAIIEVQRQQQQYRVNDKLPVSGNVTLIKILPDRVVLNNGGEYELLMLFDSSAAIAVPLTAAPLTPPGPVAQRKLDQRGNREITAMAEAYRRRLYSNPQSLSDVVKIAAVRDNGQLRGYRVSAGRDRKQFESLGFKSNDVVTGVNGVELTDPGKAVELYRIMRSAEEASFNVLRGGDEITLVVGLGASLNNGK